MDELDRLIDQEIESTNREIYKWVDEEPLYYEVSPADGRLSEYKKAESMWHAKERQRRNRGVKNGSLY